jgi:SNF2 family DNA or RNA helicase
MSLTRFQFLEPFLLRRTKSLLQLPPKSEVVFYTSMTGITLPLSFSLFIPLPLSFSSLFPSPPSFLLLPLFPHDILRYLTPDLQRDCYKKILLREAVTERRTRTSLLNTLMQLRKCANHPYLFDGEFLFTLDFPLL